MEVLKPYPIRYTLPITEKESIAIEIYLKIFIKVFPLKFSQNFFSLKQKLPKKYLLGVFTLLLEAPSGVEPDYKALQASA